MNESLALSVCIDLVCRERITQYIALKMPEIEEKWKKIRANFQIRNKMALDSWAGDLFAKCFNELRIAPEKYEEYKNKFFHVDGEKV